MSNGMNQKFWPWLLILIGAVWLIEVYTKIKIPIVPIILILIGLYFLFKK